MDTSEVTIADEDDRKLFVGGLPQVLVFVSWCYLQPGFLTTPDIKNSSKSNQPLISVFQDAKQDDISAHFQSFGELDNINLKTDPATGRSR